MALKGQHFSGKSAGDKDEVVREEGLKRNLEAINKALGLSEEGATNAQEKVESEFTANIADNETVLREGVLSAKVMGTGKASGSATKINTQTESWGSAFGKEASAAAKNIDEAGNAIANALKNVASTVSSSTASMGNTLKDAIARGMGSADSAIKAMTIDGVTSSDYLAKRKELYENAQNKLGRELTNKEKAQLGKQLDQFAALSIRDKQLTGSIGDKNRRKTLSLQEGQIYARDEIERKKVRSEMANLFPSVKDFLTPEDKRAYGNKKLYAQIADSEFGTVIDNLMNSLTGVIKKGVKRNLKKQASKIEEVSKENGEIITKAYEDAVNNNGSNGAKIKIVNQDAIDKVNGTYSYRYGVPDSTLTSGSLLFDLYGKHKNSNNKSVKFTNKILSGEKRYLGTGQNNAEFIVGFVDKLIEQNKIKDKYTKKYGDSFKTDNDLWDKYKAERNSVMTFSEKLRGESYLQRLISESPIYYDILENSFKKFNAPMDYFDPFLSVKKLEASEGVQGIGDSLFQDFWLEIKNQQGKKTKEQTEPQETSNKAKDTAKQATKSKKEADQAEAEADKAEIKNNNERKAVAKERKQTAENKSKGNKTKKDEQSEEEQLNMFAQLRDEQLRKTSESEPLTTSEKKEKRSSNKKDTTSEETKQDAGDLKNSTEAHKEHTKAAEENVKAAEKDAQATEKANEAEKKAAKARNENNNKAKRDTDKVANEESVSVGIDKDGNLIVSGTQTFYSENGKRKEYIDGNGNINRTTEQRITPKEADLRVLEQTSKNTDSYLKQKASFIKQGKTDTLEYKTAVKKQSDELKKAKTAEDNLISNWDKLTDNDKKRFDSSRKTTYRGSSSARNKVRDAWNSKADKEAMTKAKAGITDLKKIIKNHEKAYNEYDKLRERQSKQDKGIGTAQNWEKLIADARKRTELSKEVLKNAALQQEANAKYFTTDQNRIYQKARNLSGLNGEKHTLDARKETDEIRKQRDILKEYYNTLREAEAAKKGYASNYAKDKNSFLTKGYYEGALAKESEVAKLREKALNAGISEERLGKVQSAAIKGSGEGLKNNVQSYADKLISYLEKEEQKLERAGKLGNTLKEKYAKIKSDLVQAANINSTGLNAKSLSNNFEDLDKIFNSGLETINATQRTNNFEVNARNIEQMYKRIEEARKSAEIIPELSGTTGKDVISEKYGGGLDKTVTLLHEKIASLKTAQEELNNMQLTGARVTGDDALAKKEAEIERLKSEIASLSPTVEKLQSLMSGGGGLSTGIAVNNMDELVKATREYAEALDYVNVKSEQVNTHTKSVNATYSDQAGNLYKISTSMDTNNRQMKINNESMEQRQSALKNLASSSWDFFKMYFSAYTVVPAVMDKFKQGFEDFSQYQKALTNISYTMNLNKKGLSQLGQSAVSDAKKIGTSVENMTGVYQIYSNMQETTPSISRKAKATGILANLSGEDAQTAADQIQGVIQQFGMKDTSKNVMHVVDALDKISANVPIDYGKFILPLMLEIA
jgi:hypothetical protein